LSAGPSWFQRYLLPGFAFKAFVIGGGYATGREIAEFFVPAGPRGGLWAMALATLLFSLICIVTFLYARLTASNDYRAFFRHLLGRYWGLFEVAYLLMFILILAVYGAAAGAIGEAMFGWPTIAGVLVLMATIAAFTAFGNVSVEWLFQYASYFLYGVYAIFVIVALGQFGGRTAETLATGTGGEGWIVAGVTYTNYNVVGAVAILPVLRHLTSTRDAVIAGALAGPLTVLPALLFFLCMMAWYPQIGAEALPADFMLRQLGMPLLHGAFQAMIFFALVQSSVSTVHAINERIAGWLAERRGLGFGAVQRFASTAVLLVIAIFIAQRFGLVDLIAKGYRGLAVMFLAVFVLPLLTVGLWRLARPGKGALA
jgi:uncharacterized membrane protein YkvI